MAINWDNVWKQNTGESRPAQRSATREGGAAVTGAIDWDAARARVQAEKKQNRMQEVKAASERRREAEAEQQRQKQARIDAGRQANKLKTLPQLMEGYAPEEAAAAIAQKQTARRSTGSGVPMRGIAQRRGETLEGLQEGTQTLIDSTGAAATGGADSYARSVLQKKIDRLVERGQQKNASGLGYYDTPEGAAELKAGLSELQKIFQTLTGDDVQIESLAAAQAALDENLPIQWGRWAEVDAGAGRAMAAAGAQQDAAERGAWQRYYDKYLHVMENADFAKNSQYRNTKNGEAEFNPLLGEYTASGFGDLLYDYINGNEEARNIQFTNDAARGFAALGLDESFLTTMSRDEVRIYNYLYRTEGKEAADGYLEYLHDELTARQRQQTEAWFSQYAQEHPVASSVLSTAMAPARGLSYLMQAGDYLTDGKIAQNAGYNKFSYVPNAIRTTVSKRWGPAGSFAYQTGMSMADFLTTLGVSGGNSGLSLAIMGTGAAADATIDAKDRGLSDGQAFALGTIAGLAEVVTEKVSIEALLDMTSLSKSTVGYVLQNVLSEGSEEVGSDVINLLADVLVAKDKSQWLQSVSQYYAEGMSRDEAFAMAVRDQAQEMGLDFLGGAISGGVMAGASVGINRAGEALDRRALNRAMEQAKKEPLQDAENNGRLTLPTLEKPAQPTAERAAEANTAPVEGRAAAEQATAVDTQPKGHTKEENRIIREFTNAVNARMMDWLHRVKTALSGGDKTATKMKLVMSPVTENTAAAVKAACGVDVSGFQHMIDGSAVQHIEKRHGETGSSDQSMRNLEDLARAQYVLEHFDRCEPLKKGSGETETSSQYRNSDNSPAVMIRFSKKVDGSYYIVEATPDSAAKKLHIVTAYIKKSSGSITQALNVENSPQHTSETPLDPVASATPSIAQPQTEVNPTADAENDGRLRLPTLEDEAAQPTAERAAEANTAPVEPMSVQQAWDVLSEFEGEPDLTEAQQRMVDAARETVQEWENGIGQPVGQTERTEQNDGTEQTAAAAEAGADPAVRGPERESAENDALADRTVAGGGQPRAAGQSQSKTAARRSLKAEQLRLKPVSTKSLGLENGTDRARVTVYPREAWDAELTQAAKALEDKGYEVQFVLGAMEFAKPAMLTDGCVVGNKVIVRANSMRHTATELCEHERFHTLMNENPGASAMIWEKVDAELWDSRYDRLVEQYVQTYLEAYEGDEARIREELMADAYAGLNRFGEMPEVQRMVRELAQQFESGETADLLQGQVEPGMRSSQTAREQNRTRDGTAQHSIMTTADGKKYVRADRQVIFGNDPAAWGEQVEDYINGKIRKGQNVQLTTEDGDTLTLTETSAGKLSDNHTSDGRTMSDTAFERKVNAATHIDELSQTSKRRPGVPKADHDSRHGEMASGGWSYRKAFFEDFDGKYYEITISAAHSAGGKMIYNIGQMKEEAHPKIKGSRTNKGDGPRGFASSQESVTQSPPSVKGQYSLTPETKADNHPLKEAQLRVIQQSNPADDTYHTWIRDVEDIHTLDEVLEDPEWDYDEFDPDYTRAMAEDAIQTGEIRVYSSYPITEGVFVTPSEMEAESYSADGRVYSEVVPIEDVAWIDPTQGQYAPVSVNGLTVDRTSYSLTQATEGRKMSSRARRDVNQTMNAVQTELRGLIEAETRAARDTQKQVLAELAQTALDGKNISQEQINDAFETVWNAGRVVDRSAGEAAWDVKEYLRTQGVALSEADQANFADWNAFRRSNFGRLRISKDGTPVDVAYGELNGMRPDLFPADIVNPADQLERMAAVAESLQPKEIDMDSRYSMADKGQMMSQFVDMVQRMERKLLTQRTPSARPQKTQAAADETKEFWDALQDWMVGKAKRDGADAQETIGGEDYAPEPQTDYVGAMDERSERLHTEAEQREAQRREELKARAMQMKQAGENPGEILIQTQWYVDNNGEWRHWDDLPTKAAQPDSQGEQLQEAYLRGMTRDGFQGTEHLEKLGVKVAGSVANYRIVDQLIENAEAAKAVRRDIRKAERRLNASQKEKAFASSLAAGVMDETDIPASMDRNTVLELADYYILERGVARNDLRTRRNEMYAGVDREVETLMRDREAYHISSAPVMMWRTPQRSMIRMFGREQGQKIYDFFFAPVAANEAERYRWVNRMYNEVREVEGSDGTRKPLNQKERALTQMLMEGKAVEEMAAQMEERQTVYNAAENLRKGAAMEDVAKEFGLSREMRDTVRTYAEWVNHREEIYNTDGVDVKRIENAAKLYAEKYDQFYAAINDFLVAHGYEPIGFIRGYAPHIQPETQQTLLQKALSGMGLSDGVTTLPASIAGRTSQFRPNKRWNPFFQSRNGDTTAYDVTQGYERYVDYLSDILYHTDDIVRIRRASDYFRRTYAPQEIRETLDWAEFMRDASPARKAELLQDEGVLDKSAVLTSEAVNQQFEQYLSDLYGNLKGQSKYSNFVNWLEDYANGLAGKQSVLDRSFEMGVGRTAMNLVNKVTRAFQTANVAGNLSSVLNQSSQLPNIIAENGTRHTAQAIRDVATGRLNRDGWRERSDFLAGKKGIDKLIVSPTEKVVTTMFKPAEVADYMMSCVAVRSAYLKALSEGMSDADAMRYADRKAEQIMGSRMKGSAPQAFRSKNPVVKMLNMFQTEALNSFEHVEQDLIIQGIRDIKAIDDTQGRRAAAKALVATLAKTILAAFLLNRATDELYGGTPAQYDLLGYAANFMASGNGITANQQIVDWLDSTWEACFGERLFDEPEKNEAFDWSGAMEGLAYDVNSDLPLVRNMMGLLGLGDQSLPMPDFSKIGDAVKATSEYGLSAGPAWLAAAGEFVPGGRQLTKTAKGAAVMAKGGSYSEDGKRLRYPVEDSAWNWGRALLFGPSALRETNAYYARGGGALSGKETTAYQDMVEAGVGQQTAYRTLREVRQLTPEDGSDSVRDIQKWELIAAAGMSESGKLAALSAMMSDSQREKLLTATDYGVTAEQYVAFRRLLSEAESQTQEAAQAAIDQMDGLTTKQKAVLWQLANKAWKAKNNPYSTKIGAEIAGE